ncbi:GNAT family N-acetyltransferase [Kitasatospora sp. NPDC048365]|uniref:GNAT family N-acetyltransferase n=1 Tax=Kitasatospora sp. NPDC048365 TaxID=3364050 RepID=UPI00371ECBD8
MDTPADLRAHPPADHPSGPAAGHPADRSDGAPGRLELANDNAAAFWLAQAAANGWDHLRRPHYTAVRRDGVGHRVVITRPYAEPDRLRDELADLLIGTWGGGPFCLEDPYGRLDLAALGCEAGLGQAVMVREPGPLPAAALTTRRPPRPTEPAPAAREGRERRDVREVVDADGLADVERVVVDGFPIRDRQPWHRGELLPHALLAQPGVRAWLGLLDGRPAGACITYEDLRTGTVGVYWVATLADHRSRGIARAVVTHALAAHPDRTATLVATLLGEPLYRHLGFTPHALTHWWRHQPH